MSQFRGGQMKDWQLSFNYFISVIAYVSDKKSPVSECVEFNAPLDTIQVISEAEKSPVILSAE